MFFLRLLLRPAAAAEYRMTDTARKRLALYQSSAVERGTRRDKHGHDFRRSALGEYPVLISYVQQRSLPGGERGGQRLNLDRHVLGDFFQSLLLVICRKSGDSLRKFGAFPIEMDVLEMGAIGIGTRSVYPQGTELVY